MAILRKPTQRQNTKVPTDGRDPIDRRKRLVEEKLNEAIGRPPADEKEATLRQATVAVLSGEMTPKQAKTEYEVSQAQIQKFMQRTFATEEDRYEFVENCFLTNAVLSSAIFEKKHTELSAIDAARAASMFSKGATEIRKARQSDFKEPPLRVDVILSLEQSLKTLNTEAVVTRLPEPTPDDE